DAAAGSETGSGTAFPMDNGSRNVSLPQHRRDQTMIRRWNHFWFAPTSAKPLGAMRILFGLIVLLNLAILIPDLDNWFTDKGRLQGTEAKDLAGVVWSSRFNVPMRYSPLQTYRSIGAVSTVFAATAIVAMLFT